MIIPHDPTLIPKRVAHNLLALDDVIRLSSTHSKQCLLPVHVGRPFIPLVLQEKSLEILAAKVVAGPAERCLRGERKRLLV